MWSGPPACHAGLLAGIFGARNKRTHAGQEAGMAASKTPLIQAGT